MARKGREGKELTREASGYGESRRWPGSGPLGRGEAVRGRNLIAVANVLRWLERLSEKSGNPVFAAPQRRSAASVTDEGGYVPLAEAYPDRNFVLVNENATYNRDGGDNHPGRFERFVAAHELGHTAQGRYIKNRHDANEYLRRTGQPTRNETVMSSRVGRGDARANRTDYMQRDRYGMPWYIPKGGTTHSSAGETYASDFARAIGYGGLPANKMREAGGYGTGISTQRLRELRRKGLLPKRVAPRR